MSKSTSPGADKAQDRRQKARGKRQRDSQEIKYHISTYISQQDGKNKNTLPLSLSAAVCLGSFHYHFPRFSYSYLPYSIFGICICSTTLFLLHALTPFARVGRHSCRRRHRPTARVDSGPRRRRWRSRSHRRRERENDSYANALYANLPGHMIVFFFFFPLPLLFIMNYWTIGSLSKYKLSNKFERVQNQCLATSRQGAWLSSSALGGDIDTREFLLLACPSL